MRHMTLPPSDNEAKLAGISREVLARVVADDVFALRVESTDERIELPAIAGRLLLDVLATLAAGNAVSLVPIHAELTTQQAAQLLGVSRPFLIKQLERGEIKFRMVGSHRRILFKDLLEFKRREDARSEAALDELANSARDLSID